MTLRLAFLASHGGSAARALVQACRAGELDAEPLALASNNSRSPALAWAREAGLRTAHLSSATSPDPDALDAAIHDFLVGSGADTLVLSGYMKALGPRTLGAFAGRVLNIHPSLLPRHGGRGLYGDRVHESVLAAGDPESGATVHLVTAGIDEGPVLEQVRVPVLPGDTLDTLKARVQAEEAALMLRAVQSLAARHG
ncbi:phosphoribosylglycinamide formyltransferase [Deinococcus radiodurans R1 = ATCC 13939 = DSM 20539]|uniref:Phosphoribosylglycinamide formyltransferase n=1 Tax=Deinococcus radiodurans (strain ATCC 13939 / DSM 20539 / JCM 16871 / CCUG 27074 / LMG 4051 / NBRC 15346 / NCIMB 9279 / VKM B-1422 / R1) TaxID=243230 RepID=Q9RSU6_DEIRA|nr:phosphoribosylglycinamide formyltransferase [Deinococcus radiodurans R1 = ATCC 13939 = DSM 20539]QEM71420.1 phosphoribosylglycinamide formyltransferase [Deinococcus radiodurans]UDL01070.1 phosphoribosylglycinamide formyltransferase [Deinococcus radiodurans R1 = ATCC 13939 = DSM 20539]UID70993.1 phosphoribosylglycinamide formyltransferase [Deinococcus radiodurans R1 = ATCC 13939 = DSM 20539]HCE65741.1 phosphoribosylglycinamide formyltransferase [Deinococcus radiodurans]